ncbi:hypothetical protein LTR66_005595 [Elasticomyces elasticus]|nr:hypothetical protein LTR66_005595 [Elasticomyces elasticus]
MVNVLVTDRVRVMMTTELVVDSNVVELSDDELLEEIPVLNDEVVIEDTLGGDDAEEISLEVLELNGKLLLLPLPEAVTGEFSVDDDGAGVVLLLESASVELVEPLLEGDVPGAPDELVEVVVSVDGPVETVNVVTVLSLLAVVEVEINVELDSETPVLSDVVTGPPVVLLKAIPVRLLEEME